MTELEDRIRDALPMPEVCVLVTVTDLERYALAHSRLGRLEAQHDAMLEGDPDAHDEDFEACAEERACEVATEWILTLNRVIDWGGCKGMVDIP